MKSVSRCSVMQMCYSGDMTKTAYINARIDKKIKADAQKVLREVGVNTSDAIGMFYRQIVMQKGIPFEVRIPNKETIAAIRELEAGGGKRFNSVEALFEDALGTSWRSKLQGRRSRNIYLRNEGATPRRSVSKRS